MKLKSIIDSPCGLRYCFEQLPLSSGFSRRFFLESESPSSAEEVISIYKEISSCMDGCYSTLQFKLQYLKDIRSTISRIASKMPLDDIELFEIKSFALICCEIREHILTNDFKMTPPDSLSEVVDILDPDRLKIASFYIYDSYSEELSSLRLRLKQIGDDHLREEIEEKISVLESVIRKQLSLQLFPYVDSITSALNRCAQIDILIAKVLSAKANGYSIPTLSHNGITSYRGLFHPYVKSLVEERGDSYQKVDISFGSMPTLIIGANMGGKTVVLKSLSLCQYSFLFGMPIPAKSAEIAYKKDIFLSIGDQQSELDGLSSFGAEMKALNGLISEVKSGKDVVSFIDEPAKSTNPIEGTALVVSLINLLSKYSSFGVITTHYNVDIHKCNRLKVKGIEDGKMCYSLISAPSGTIPHEAIKVARSLKIDNEWLDEAETILNER